MVLIFGDEPSKRTDPNIPFKGAGCEKRLHSWIEELSIIDYILLNTHDLPGNNVSMLWLALATLENYPIIALGVKASSRLKKLGYDSFRLPHPSGLNRQNNDKEFIAEKLLQCKRWLENEKY